MATLWFEPELASSTAGEVWFLGDVSNIGSDAGAVMHRALISCP